MYCDQFRTMPKNNTLGVTMVTCTHAYHGVEVFYFDVEQWGESFMHAIGPFWTNGYTIVCQPV